MFPTCRSCDSPVKRKPLHYFMRKSAYADVTAACGDANLQMGDAGSAAAGPTMCFVKNDSPRDFAGSVSVQLVHYGTAKVDQLATVPVKLAPGAGTTSFFCPDGTNADADAGACPMFDALLTKAGCASDGSDCILRVTVTQSNESQQANAGGQFLLADNLLPLAKPSAFKLPTAAVTATIVSFDETAGTASISLESKSAGVALYVWLVLFNHVL